MSQIHEAILSDRSIAGEYALRQHGCCASRLPDEVNQSAPDDHESQYEQNEAHRPGNHVRIVDEIKEVIFTAGHDLPKRSALDNLVVGQNMTLCQISASQQTDAGASMQRPIIRFDVIEKISEGNGIVSGQEHHGNAADAIGQAGVFFDDTPTIVRLLDGQISCCGARDPHEYRNSGVYEGLHLIDQSVAASAGMLPTPLSHVKPYAAATTDHTGCVHIGPAREIEEIAASGAKGPTEVVYLYIGPSPQTHMVGSKAIMDVVAERLRQQSAEGWSLEHDDGHSAGEMAAAAATYAYSTTLSDRHRQYVSGIYSIENSATLRELWPPSWSRTWWKITDRRRDLVKAAALLIAEIERLDRAALATEGKV